MFKSFACYLGALALSCLIAIGGVGVVAFAASQYGRWADDRAEDARYQPDLTIGCTHKAPHPLQLVHEDSTGALIRDYDRSFWVPSVGSAYSRRYPGDWGATVFSLRPEKPKPPGRESAPYAGHDGSGPCCYWAGDVYHVETHLPAPQ